MLTDSERIDMYRTAHAICETERMGGSASVGQVRVFVQRGRAQDGKMDHDWAIDFCSQLPGDKRQRRRIHEAHTDKARRLSRGGGSPERVFWARVESVPGLVAQGVRIMGRR